MRAGDSTRQFLALLLVAGLSACSPNEEAVQKKSAPDQPDATAKARPAGAGKPGPLEETASAYIARRNPDEPTHPGEVGAAAVGAVVGCSVCHGPDGGGRPQLRTPRIGGLAEWYLARELKYFKAGVRGGSHEDVEGTYMRAVVMSLTDTSIEDLAAHFADQSPPPAPALDTGNAERGAELYTVCAACHGPDGHGGPEFNSPSLVQQSGTYLVRQLEHFRNGVRGTHPRDTYGQQMMPIVKSTLTSREDVIDVVSYIGTLRGSDDKVSDKAPAE